MNLEYATPEHVDEIMKIYAEAREFMRANGNPDQWGDNYPSRELILEDIEKKALFICTSNRKITACFYFKIAPDPTYEKIYNGRWIDNGVYGVIHRIAVRYPGYGFASDIYEFCMNQARKHRLCSSIRIDTHRDNKPMQRSLEKNGFTRCGIIHLANGDERIAYQYSWEMKKYTDTVTSVQNTMKIRDYLKRRLGLSTALIAQVKFNNVLLNGEIVNMRAMVKNGDVIEITLPEEEDSENISPMKIPLDIVYEDEYIIAVNKPINMPVHPSRGNSLPTVANGIREYIGRPFVFRAVNRLDRDTSGIVLIAKDRLIGAKLYQSMKDKKFDKSYIALIEGIPSPSHGRINAPIARESEDGIKRVVRWDGKPSLTEYKIIETYDNNTSLIRVKIYTGRTHQIRVHMAHIGHPLVNDFLYGTRGEKTYYLHCDSLSFPHPITGEMMTLTAKEPPKE